VGSVRVQLDKSAEVLERVSLLVVSLDAVDSGSQLALHLIAVDDASQVRVEHQRARQRVASLLSALAGLRSPDGVELLECSASPDDESAQVTTGRELQQVQAVDRRRLHTRQVAESLGDAIVRGEDDERSTAHDVATVARLADTAADFAGVSGLLHVGVGAHGLQGSNGLLRLGDALDGVVDDKRNLRHALDLVSTSHHKRRQSAGSQRRGNGVALLVGVDLAVPLSPRLCCGEHSTLAAHVSEGTLARSRVTTTRNTRDTSDGATSTPRLSGVLHAAHLVDSISLTLVLVH